MQIIKRYKRRCWYSVKGNDSDGRPKGDGDTKSVSVPIAVYKRENGKKREICKAIASDTWQEYMKGEKRWQRKEIIMRFWG